MVWCAQPYKFDRSKYGGGYRYMPGRIFARVIECILLKYQKDEITGDHIIGIYFQGTGHIILAPHSRNLHDLKTLKIIPALT